MLNSGGAGFFLPYSERIWIRIEDQQLPCSLPALHEVAMEMGEGGMHKLYARLGSAPLASRFAKVTVQSQVAELACTQSGQEPRTATLIH